MNKQGSYSSS